MPGRRADGNLDSAAGPRASTTQVSGPEILISTRTGHREVVLNSWFRIPQAMRESHRESFRGPRGVPVRGPRGTWSRGPRRRTLVGG